MLFHGGCAATQIALEHKNLEIQSKMSATIFLDVEKRQEKTVYLDIKNTSDKEVDVQLLIKARLEKSGYTILPNAKDAFYILQLNILQVGKSDPSALRDALGAGFGGPLACAVAGTVIGANSSSPLRMFNGGAIGGLLGGAGEMISGALVKNVTYSMITDVRILERTDEAAAQQVESSFAQGTGTQVTQSSQGTTTRHKFQTRVVSTANQVNLKFEEAVPQLQAQLAKSVASIL